MSEREKDTTFLRQCIVYEDSAERHKLEESITQLQRNGRCMRRAIGLMAMLVALATAGLSCSAVLLADYPQNMTQFINKVFCALGLGSLICLMAFAGLAAVYRTELDQCREECRRLARKLLEGRVAKATIAPPSLMPRRATCCNSSPQENDSGERNILQQT